MERQRIWLSLSLITLGMVCMTHEEAHAWPSVAIKKSFAPANKIVASAPRFTPRIESVKCPDLPSSCGLVSKSKNNGCPVFWYTHLSANTLESCGTAASSDLNFSQYVSCSRMYRNLSKFADLDFSRQFGGIAIFRGACAPLTSFPVCNQIAPVPAGSFCKCPSGSVTAVAGCEPNEGSTSCLSTSIANQCEG